jgi:drug/metabolite transporter (DMT)-like permease
MSARVWLWLLTLSVLWGGSFFFAKIAVGELPPLTLVLGRVGLAALVLNAILGPRRLTNRCAPWRSFVVMGALNNALPFALIFWGQTRIASGLAAILNATTPLFTILVAHLATSDEKLSANKIVALATGLAGVALLVGPDALSHATSGLWGQAACLGAALSYAIAGVYGRRFRSMGIAPMEAVAGQLTAASLLILPIMLVVDRPWLHVPSAGGEVWSALAGLALLSTALAYVLYFRILAASGATNLLLVTFLIPVTAIVLGAAFLGERLEPRHFSGMTLIGAGLAIIDGRLARLLRRAK